MFQRKFHGFRLIYVRKMFQVEISRGQCNPLKKESVLKMSYRRAHVLTLYFIVYFHIYICKLRMIIIERVLQELLFDVYNVTLLLLLFRTRLL